MSADGTGAKQLTGDEMGAAGHLTTCFPWRRTGRKARAGTGQIGLISYTEAMSGVMSASMLGS